MKNIITQTMPARAGSELAEEEQTLFFPLRPPRPLRLCERNYRKSRAEGADEVFSSSPTFSFVTELQLLILIKYNSPEYQTIFTCKMKLVFLIIKMGLLFYR